MYKKRLGKLLRRFLYSRWESNPNLRFRKPPFYPLNYRSIIEIGWLVAWRPASRFMVS